MHTGYTKIVKTWVLPHGVPSREWRTCADEGREGGGSTVMEVPKSGVGHAILPRVFTEHLTHWTFGLSFTRTLPGEVKVMSKDSPSPNPVLEAIGWF